MDEGDKAAIKFALAIVAGGSAIAVTAILSLALGLRLIFGGGC